MHSRDACPRGSGMQRWCDVGATRIGTEWGSTRGGPARRGAAGRRRSSRRSLVVGDSVLGVQVRPSLSPERSGEGRWIRSDWYGTRRTLRSTVARSLRLANTRCQPPTALAWNTWLKRLSSQRAHARPAVQAFAAFPARNISKSLETSTVKGPHQRMRTAREPRLRPLAPTGRRPRNNRRDERPMGPRSVRRVSSLVRVELGGPRLPRARLGPSPAPTPSSMSAAPPSVDIRISGRALRRTRWNCSGDFGSPMPSQASNAQRQGAKKGFTRNRPEERRVFVEQT